MLTSFILSCEYLDFSQEYKSPEFKNMVFVVLCHENNLHKISYYNILEFMSVTYIHFYSEFENITPSVGSV